MIPKIPLFQMFASERIIFERNRFIEVARILLNADDGRCMFLQIKKGYYTPSKIGITEESVTIPDNEDIKKDIAERLMKI